MFAFKACDENSVYDPEYEEERPIDVVASYRLTEHERKNCRVRVQRFINHDSRYEELRSLLLKKGGLDVMLQRDDHLRIVIEDGEFWTEATTTAQGDKYASHMNAAELYEDGTIDAIGHGWALSAKTGLWHHHTWGIVDEATTVVETTEESRAAYFGVPLTGKVEKNPYTIRLLENDAVCQGD